MSDDQLTTDNEQLPEGYKQTEVGVIPKDWSVFKLRDIAPLQRGFDLPTSQLKKGVHPVVYSNGVMNHHADFMAAAPGVVTGRSGTIGNVHYIAENYWPHNTALWVTDFKGNDPKYIYYLYKCVNLERFGTGSGVPTLNRNDVHDLAIAAPPLEEQRSIAQALSDVDRLIAALEKAIAKKRAIKTATMQQLLTGKKRLPGFGEGKGDRQTEVGLIPEDWEVKAVGAVCDFIVPGRNKPRTFKGDIPWITTPDLEDGRGVSKSKLGLFVSRDEAKSVGSRIVPTGSILMSCVGELGIVALVEREIVINQQLHAFIPSEAVDSTFLLNALQAQKAYMLSIATITAVPYLNKDNCNSIPIPLPHPSEQRAIATVLSDMDGAIAALETRLAKTQALKQGMIQALLTGRVRLKIEI